MILPSFPDLSGLVVNLEFLRKSEFNVMHEMAVDAFLRHHLNLGEQYSKLVSIITPENGRLQYRQGDSYRFAIIFNGEEKDVLPIWQKLISQLRRLPESALITDKNVPIKDNVKLIGLQDLFDGIPVQNELSLDFYTEKQLLEQAQAWFKEADLKSKPVELHWSWQSLVRLLKEDHKYSKGELRFCRDNQSITPHLLLKRLYETLTNIAAQFDIRLDSQLDKLNREWLEQQSEFLEIDKADCFWLDTPYFSQDKSKNTLGGLAGSFRLQIHPGAEPGLLALLILGQVLGFGQRRTSGFGKYRLEPSFKSLPLALALQPYKVTRAQSLLECLTQEHILAQAVKQVEQKPQIDKLNERTHSQIQSAIGQIKSSSYQAPQMQGFTIPKKDGDSRLIAVSPLYDRVLQKAASLVLTPGLDAFMAQGSYGYRKGLSRQQVRYEIQNAYREGYRWVYESDIDDFFDSINRPQLYSRLQSLFGDDPLWQQLENWLSQNIKVGETLIDRSSLDKGIPQGSPLSPLLSNFILDDFDSDLELHGFKMIRFADDFIILCKNRHQAELAAKGVEYSLSQVKLEINRDKTHIVEMQQGFRFLGYLFREDHAIEVAGEKSDGKSTFSAEDIPTKLPPWLANIGAKQAQAIDSEDLPEKHHGKLEQQGMHLILAGDAQIITTDNHNVVVKKDDKITHKVSWEQLHAITLIGLHTMTLPAQHQALRNKIPVHLSDRTGHYLGALVSFEPAQNSYKTWFTQLQQFDNPEFCLAIAKQLVISRMHNQRHTLFKRKEHRKQMQTSLAKLKTWQHKAQSVDNLNSLNGIEGTATREYFKQINQFLPEWAKFERRTRRPPKDPFNVLLSLGYTILYSHVDSILQSAGFLTWKGLYHQQSAAHAALASDLMESYRHIVERFAIYVINHKQIKEQDFRIEELDNQKQALRLSAEARRRYVSGLINRFQKFKKEQTLHQHLYEQARALKLAVQAQNPKTFQCWKELK